MDRRSLPHAIKRGSHPLSRRIVAFLLLALVAFLVINPIWECQDHLDNLRHLGPHGMLVILLAVSLAGISLLKSVRALLFRLVSSIAMHLETILFVRPIVATSIRPLAPEAGPPLRI